MDISIQEYIKHNYENMITTLKELCVIPAPSHYEQKRAEYCKAWLEEAGAKNVYIDEALNVIYCLNCEHSDEITVFAAHTDTVFPDTTPFSCFDDGEKIHCPGAADDTASLVVLLTMAKFFIEKNIVPQKGIMFCCNSCEEGLGNLKGTRQIFDDYKGRIKQFITFDSSLNILVDKCVGSHRYEVEVLTEGGHSYLKFGNNNAIAELSKIVNKIYQLEVPKKPGTKTTYNIGTITGGTSINTIAQNATMLCEYRSDDIECLEIMEKAFKDIFAQANTDAVKVNVKKIGDRPCSNTDLHKIDLLKEIATPIIEKVIGEKVSNASSSTDCNIPLSLGIPSLCVGVNNYYGIHTREEWVDKKSIGLGLEIAIKLGLAITEVQL